LNPEPINPEHVTQKKAINSILIIDQSLLITVKSEANFTGRRRELDAKGKFYPLVRWDPNLQEPAILLK
jgi:hypothetical protein